MMTTKTKTITTGELRDLRTSNPDCMLLDVLPKERFDHEHIEGAANVPLHSADFLQRVDGIANGKSRTIVVCSGHDAGDDSGLAVARLTDAGYGDVSTYRGTAAAYRAGPGLPTEQSQVAGQPDDDAEPRAATADGLLRARASSHTERGAVTPGYAADRSAVLRMLDSALATELVSMLRYQRQASMARGLVARSIAQEFRDHAHEEAAHAELLATRIVQLGGQPDFSPDRLSQRSEAEYTDSIELSAMIHESLVAERITVDSYRAMIVAIGNDDPTTRRMLETILAMEEEHAEDLASLLDDPLLPRDTRRQG